MNTSSITQADSAINNLTDIVANSQSDSQATSEIIESMNKVYDEICVGSSRMDALLNQWNEQRNALMQEYTELSNKYWLLREKTIALDVDTNGISYWF